jgi:hypothetical protein
MDALESPLDDILEEAERLSARADAARITMRLFGGAAVGLRSPSAQQAGLTRKYKDIDLAAPSKERMRVEQLLENSGYEADRRFNALHGHQRLIFHDPIRGRQIDVFLDRLRMCHTIDFSARLRSDPKTLPLAELLLFKLQIVEANRKDLIDIVALLGDHELSDVDGETINVLRVLELIKDDWGLFHTSELSLAKVRDFAGQVSSDLPFAISEQVDLLLARMRQEPKTTRWKLRARVGERIPWYELPDEVRD